MSFRFDCVDRRKLERIQVNAPAVAVVRAKPALILGQIRDIGLGGLSFTYIYNAVRPREDPKVDLFLPRDNFFLDGIPFATVSDVIVLPENPFHRVAVCRRGIRFLDLTPLQVTRLSQMIRMTTRMLPEYDFRAAVAGAESGGIAGACVVKNGII